MRLTQATLLRARRRWAVAGNGWTSSSADSRVWTLKLDPGWSSRMARHSQPRMSSSSGARQAGREPAGLKPAHRGSAPRVRAIDDDRADHGNRGPRLSLLDAIPILPRHKLEAALKAGTFHDAWGLRPPRRPGRAVRAQELRSRRAHDLRATHYWRQDEKGGAAAAMTREIVLVERRLLRLEAARPR